MSNVLCMIVRNEEKYIERCLNSVLPYVEAVCISDTGSTDRTVEIIKETLNGSRRSNGHIPAWLSTVEWSDYSTNRNFVIEKAKESFPWADMHLWMDADDVFNYPLPPECRIGWGMTDADGYLIEHRLGDVSFYRASLVRTKSTFKYYGKCHEVLLRHPEDPLNLPVLRGAYIECNAGIDFKPPDHYLEHAKLLEGETDPRSVFYLAQSYQMADHPEKAIEHYIRRTRMDGNREELYHSYFRLGQLTAEPGLFLKAANVNSTRPEPWFELYQWAQGNGMSEADDFLFIAASKRIPRGMLIDKSIPRKISKILGDEE